MRLSKHFSLEEMTVSQVAARRGIDNEPRGHVVARLMRLCTSILEPIRIEFGPVIITSGYRSPELNLAVGGAANSSHTFGAAADIILPQANLDVVFDWVRKNLVCDQCIREFPPGGWIHVAVPRIDHEVSRQQFLIATRSAAGKTEYRSA